LAPGGLAPIDAEFREPTDRIEPLAPLVDALRALGQARFARANGELRMAAEAAIRQVELRPERDRPMPVADLQPERHIAPVPPALPPTPDPAGLAAALAVPLARHQPVETVLQFQDHALGVSLTPDLDGYQTLCLLPPTDLGPVACVELMRAVAWDVIEALIGRPLAERRTEPIALRLITSDGRTTTLDIGASVVVVRNQTVFTAWVGADGRVMLKLFPPGGMKPGA
jgi:hypothetical protein